MSTMTPTQPIALPASPYPVADVYRMNIDEFERIADSLDVERVELIDGILVERGDMDPPHAVASVRLRFYLDRLVPDGWFVREDKPLRVHRTYEPFPDLAIVRGNPLTAYLDRHPGPHDVAIVTEISDSTLAKDRGEKRANYAGGGITVYWIVNLIDSQVEVYTGPGADGYSACVTYKPGESVPVVIDGAEVGRIAVSDILPPPDPAAGGDSPP
jgi:Uma2 family endonuclease